MDVTSTDNVEDALEIMAGLRDLLEAAAAGAEAQPIGAAGAALVAERIAAACDLLEAAAEG